jgi:hypothetical protein
MESLWRELHMAMSHVQRSAGVLVTVALSLGLVWSGGGERHPMTRPARSATATWEGLRGIFLSFIGNLNEAYGDSSTSNSPSQPGHANPGSPGQTDDSGSSLDPNG